MSEETQRVDPDHSGTPGMGAEGALLRLTGPYLRTGPDPSPVSYAEGMADLNWGIPQDH